MKRSFVYQISVFVIALAMLAGFVSPAMAHPAYEGDCSDQPCVSTIPPMPEDLAPDGNAIKALNTSRLNTENPAPLNLPAMKAVLIVGPIDGDTGSWTTREIANAEDTAATLAEYGVQVYKFYTPNNDWEQIKAAADGAHFLMYRGHGISWGGNPPEVGGFALKSALISSDQIRAGLHLAPNAIVMMYSCFSAGGSGTDTPPGITQAEAYRRVAQYSAPFLDMGIAGYYADWYGYAFRYFINDLFSGKTMGEAYKNFNFDPNTYTAGTYPNRPDTALWLDYHYYASQNQYNHAFVGKPNLKLSDLFTAKLEVSTKQIEAMSNNAFVPEVKQYSVTVKNSLSLPFNWSASLVENAPWANLNTTNAMGGEDLKVTIIPNDLQPGTYSTQVRVTSTTPGIQENEQLVTVTLHVVNYDKIVFLAALVR
ncbi:MAG TPA: hypothetical protein VIO61_01475 [Anaerolineaceae bacterium]